MMQIRQIQQQDAASFIEFFKQLDAETKFMLFEIGERPTLLSQQIELIKKLESSVNEVIFIAIYQKHIIGFIALSRKPFNRVKHCFQLVIGVLESYHGKNLANELYQCAEQWAIDQGAIRIELSVIQENIRAIKFYEQLSFEKEGIRKKSIFSKGQLLDELYMGKILHSHIIKNPD
ncbi:GNAT family N-acetyltransferase [Acinetobacter sp. P8-3-8]|uniref:GNAT family N-acetyltransferase n=1 Tax=Acinetobacter sp. P8-3-8 TaxID=1029823 RepID=UPI0002DF9E0D|nr:GNAT family N-acetyltransferase [Acinetobacter sp. P8-3-8]